MCYTGTTQPRRNRAEKVVFFVDDCIVEEEKDLSTQFLQMQKYQYIDLQDYFGRFCNVLPVFGFNSAKYDINLIKSYLLPILVNGRDIEPTVIKKANQLVSFKIEAIHLLDIMSFLDCPENLNNNELPPFDSFFRILSNINPFEKDYNDFQNLVNSGLTTEQAVAKLRLEKLLPTSAASFLYLNSVWENNTMQYFSHFLHVV